VLIVTQSSAPTGACLTLPAVPHPSLQCKRRSETSATQKWPALGLHAGEGRRESLIVRH